MKTGKLIRKYRKLRKMTQAQLAEKAPKLGIALRAWKAALDEGRDILEWKSGLESREDAACPMGPIIGPARPDDIDDIMRICLSPGCMDGTSRSLVVGVIVLYKLRCVLRQRIDHAARKQLIQDCLAE